MLSHPKSLNHQRLPCQQRISIGLLLNLKRRAESGQQKDPIFSGENPSTTLPGTRFGDNDIKSNDATLASQRRDPAVFTAPQVSATDETKAIDAAALLPLLQDESQTENQHTAEDLDPGAAVLPDENTISHQIPAEDSMLLGQSSNHTTAVLFLIFTEVKGQTILLWQQLRLGLENSQKLQNARFRNDWCDWCLVPHPHGRGKHESP